MKRFAATLLLVAGGSYLRAQWVGTITGDLGPEVALAPLTDAEAAGLGGLFDTYPQARSGATYLENRSDRPIVSYVALVTGFNSIHPEHIRREGEEVRRTTSDPVAPIPMPPIVVPGQRVLLAPTAFLVGFAPAKVQELLSSTTGASVTIDSVLFSDGEIVGPDTEHYGDELTARRRAADTVLAAIDAGDRPALLAMQTRPFEKGNFLSNYERTYAKGYLDAYSEREQQAQRKGLVQVPNPLPFYRRPAPR